MKKAIFAIVLSLLPYLASAEDATSTEPVPEPSQIETISVAIHVRYKDSLVYSGPVQIAKGSTASLFDTSASARTLPSDAALSALVAADALSPAFSVSDIVYYEGFDSLYVRCLDLATVGKKCDNWQYVVGSSYPSVGADDYVLSDGDSVYFYFGTPRRVVLASNSAEKTEPVVVKAESYDYVNDSWKPLSGATVGATQPNPDDPYSPFVLSQATSDENGVVALSLEPGTYGIGLAADFYSFLESLVVSAPVDPEEPEEGARRSGGRSGYRSAPINSESVIAEAETTSIPAPEPPLTEAAAASSEDAAVAPGLHPAGETMIALGMPIEEFAKRYAAFFEIYSPSPALATAPETEPPAPLDPDIPSIGAQSQTASVIDAVRTGGSAPQKKGWLGRLLGLIGI